MSVFCGAWSPPPNPLSLLKSTAVPAAAAAPYERRRMNQFGEQFREFDLDRNGVVDAQEIRSALGIMPTRFVDMFLKRVDVDQDGTISRDEYLDYALSD